MRNLGWQKKERNLRNLYFYSEISKNILRNLLASHFFDWDDKFFFFKIFQKFYFKISISFFTRSCLFTGFSKSVFRLFKLSRHQVKSSASAGFITGLRKSSF